MTSRHKREKHLDRWLHAQTSLEKGQDSYSSRELSILLEKVRAMKDKIRKEQCPADTSKVPVYVRECKEAGAALVPCDPLDPHSTCPPPSNLEGTPYENLFSMAGVSPHNRVVRCVPPEMIHIPSTSPQTPACKGNNCSVLVQEKHLDTRFQNAISNILSVKDSLHDLTRWTTEAPCGAVEPFLEKYQKDSDENVCARLRFSDTRDGKRCMSEGRMCHSNLVAMRKSLTHYENRLIRMMHKLRSMVDRVRLRTNENDPESALHTIIQGMENKAYVHDACHKQTEQEACDARLNDAQTVNICMWKDDTCTPKNCTNSTAQDCTDTTPGGHGLGHMCDWINGTCSQKKQCKDFNMENVCGIDESCT